MSAAQSFHDGRIVLHAGDCLDVLKTLADNSLDSCVTDPPYHLTSIVKRFGTVSREDDTSTSDRARRGADGMARLSRGFMGKQWDGGDIAFRVELWREVFRVLKPGAHLVAFSGTRTYHRMACAIEDAGFEMRDMISWLYGSGFPKSNDVSKGIDRAAGAEREKIATGAAVKRMIPGADQHRSGWEKDDGRTYTPGVELPATEDAARWQGWGTALKPACEPIAFARKPLAEKTVAANVLKHGTGAINIDGCRVRWQSEADAAAAAATAEGFSQSRANGKMFQSQSIGKESRDGTNAYDPHKLTGRWPANIVHDGSDEVVSAFPESESGGGPSVGTPRSKVNTYGDPTVSMSQPYGANSGSAARFFYSAKADADDRIGSKHPTVKPVDLMRWLVRLVTPKGGTILEPFAGTGTTGAAAFLEGFNAVLIEREAEYQVDIARRMALLLAGPDERARVSIKVRGKLELADSLPLFGGIK